MDWLQIFALLAAIGGLFYWNRTEANADRRETNQILRELKDEMKDFHGRLLVLEDRYLRLREKE